jgi:hypothetical protein
VITAEIHRRDKRLLTVVAIRPAAKNYVRVR